MQLIAMLTMLIDHIGYIFFPDDPVWRMIGRIAFPIYAYALVQGYKYTSSRWKYLGRLFVIALISQVPYQLALDPVGLNIVATLTLALLILTLLDKIKSPLVGGLLIFGALGVMDVWPFDYGSYGLLLVLMFRYIPAAWLVPSHLLLNGVYLILNGWTLQMISIVPTLVIAYGPALWSRIEAIRVKSWVWRSFYPAHLVILAIMKYLLL